MNRRFKAKLSEHGVNPRSARELRAEELSLEQAKLVKRKSEVLLNANEQEADLRTDDSPDCERVEPTER